MDAEVASSSKNVNESFTQNATVPTVQENDVESELAVPLKDTEDNFEPPMKKTCSMEIVVPTTQPSREYINKLTPAITRLKSTCSTPLASKSFIENLKTPETPYGQIFCDKPVTPETKKKWKKYISCLCSKFSFQFYLLINFNFQIKKNDNCLHLLKTKFIFNKLSYLKSMLMSSA